MPLTALALNGTGVKSEGYPPRAPHNKKFGDRIVFTDKFNTFEFPLNAPAQPLPPVPPGATQPQHSGFCFLVGEANVWLCQAGFILPPGSGPFANGGQIQARGLMDFDKSGAPNQPPAQAAIDGGFGDYDTAGGRIDATFPPVPKGSSSGRGGRCTSGHSPIEPSIRLDPGDDGDR